MSSGFGTVLKLQLFGESHGPAVGMCLDGFPAGFRPDLTALQAFLDRRAPGRSALTSARREADRPEFLSGLADGLTCGAPLTLTIERYGKTFRLPIVFDSKDDAVQDEEPTTSANALEPSEQDSTRP